MAGVRLNAVLFLRDPCRTETGVYDVFVCVCLGVFVRVLFGLLWPRFDCDTEGSLSCRVRISPHANGHTGVLSYQHFPCVPLQLNTPCRR